MASTQFGNVTCVTSFLNSLYTHCPATSFYSVGSQRRGQLTGIIYNDEMGDFNRPTDEIAEGYLVPEVNLIEPQKRPLSSMCPVLVFDEKENVVHIIGGAGGLQITAIVASVRVLGGVESSCLEQRPFNRYTRVPCTVE